MWRAFDSWKKTCDLGDNEYWQPESQKVKFYKWQFLSSMGSTGVHSNTDTVLVTGENVHKGSEETVWTRADRTEPTSILNLTCAWAEVWHYFVKGNECFNWWCPRRIRTEDWNLSWDIILYLLMGAINLLPTSQKNIHMFLKIQIKINKTLGEVWGSRNREAEFGAFPVINLQIVF